MVVPCTSSYHLQVDLREQTVTTPSGDLFSFEVDTFRRHCLLNGLDDIGVSLESAAAIRAFEARWQQQAPWLFGARDGGH